MGFISVLVCCIGIVHIHGHGSLYLPSDCQVDNCVNSLERINQANLESYCSGLVTSWICLERILGNCYQVFEGYGKPEVNAIITNITTSIDEQCDYNNSGPSVSMASTGICILCSFMLILLSIVDIK